jgi:hypothetical protein
VVSNGRPQPALLTSRMLEWVRPVGCAQRCHWPAAVVVADVWAYLPDGWLSTMWVVKVSDLVADDLDITAPGRTSLVGRCCLAVGRSLRRSLMPHVWPGPVEAESLPVRDPRRWTPIGPTW